jgi:plasmid maintenance system antidote protein VapI
MSSKNKCATNQKGRAMLSQLIQKQKEIGATDQEFAEIMGVSSKLWNFIRNGHRRLTERTIIKAATSFPDLRETALKEMGLSDEAALPRT